MPYQLPDTILDQKWLGITSSTRQNEKMSWQYRKTFSEAQQKLDTLDYETADKLYSELIDKNSTAVEALLHRAYCRLRAHRLEDAEKDAAECTKRRPENGIMFMVLGEVFIAQKNWEKALEALKKATVLEKDNGRAYFLLGKVYSKLDKKSEAADCFETALQFERDYVMSQFMAEFFSAK